MNPGDIVSRKANPGVPYKVIEIERDRYQESNDVAHVVRLAIPNAPAIPVPRHKWSFWRVHNPQEA